MCPIFVLETKFVIDISLVRIHFIIEMIWWTGFAPREFEFFFPSSHSGPDGPASGWKVRAVLGAPDREQCRRHLPISAVMCAGCCPEAARFFSFLFPRVCLLFLFSFV